MEKILVDSCIFIDIFRGDQKLYKLVKSLNVVINPIIYMELLQGAKNKQEQIQINNFLNYFDYIPLNEAISSKSIELIKLYSNSHNLLIPDAMIAATSLLNGFPLFTFNLKDFRYIPELTFYNPQE